MKRQLLLLEACNEVVGSFVRPTVTGLMPEPPVAGNRRINAFALIAHQARPSGATPINPLTSL
jgi:hypothetical protein